MCAAAQCIEKRPSGECAFRHTAGLCFFVLIAASPLFRGNSSPEPPILNLVIGILKNKIKQILKKLYQNVQLFLFLPV